MPWQLYPVRARLLWVTVGTNHWNSFHHSTSKWMKRWKPWWPAPLFNTFTLQLLLPSPPLRVLSSYWSPLAILFLMDTSFLIFFLFSVIMIISVFVTIAILHGAKVTSITIWTTLQVFPWGIWWCYWYHRHIPHICHFWYATIIFRPVKGTPKKCVNSRQKFPRDKTA